MSDQQDGFFFLGQDSNSDSDGEDQKRDIRAVNQLRKKINIDNLESDSEEEGRVKLTEKEKKMQIFRKLAKSIRGLLKEADYTKLLQTYFLLIKEVGKSVSYFQKEGGLPEIILRCMMAIRNKVKSADEDQEKNMVNINFKAFSALRKRMSKDFKPFEQQFIKLQAKDNTQPDKHQEIDSFAGDSDQEEDQDEDKSPLKSDDPMVRRTFWLKKIKAKQEKAVQEKRVIVKTKKPEQLQSSEQQQSEDNNEAIFQLKEEHLHAKLHSLAQDKRRLKKDFDCLKAIETINSLLPDYKPKLQAQIFLLRVSLDYYRSLDPIYLPVQQWTLLNDNLRSVVALFSKYENQKIRSFSKDSLDADHDYSPSELQDLLRFFFLSLYEQLQKALIYVDYSSPEYSTRLKDFYSTLNLNYELYQLFKSRGAVGCQNEVQLKLIESLHFVNKENFVRVVNNFQPSEKAFLAYLQAGLIPAAKRLRNHYKDSPESIRIAFFIAIYCSNNNQYQQALKIYLTVAERTEIESDHFLQALANRTLVTLGLCAFNAGDYRTVRFLLSDICGSGKARQLVSQGTRFVEGRLRKKLVPYIMYISIQSVECAQLIACMLADIPKLGNSKITSASKTIQLLYDYFQSSYFILSPINNRNLIYSACKELELGNWKNCLERVEQLTIWKKYQNKDKALANLRQAIKREALRAYLFRHRASFKSILIQRLGQTFELQVEEVTKIVSGCIMEGQLAGRIQDRYLRVWENSSGVMRAAHQFQKSVESLLEKESTDTNPETSS